MKGAKERLTETVKILRKAYPSGRTALDFKTPLQIAIATILSAQCTDERVNKITPHLFKKYKTVYDLARANQKTLEGEIYSAGFYRNKAKNIIGLAKKVAADYEGKIPDNMEGLLTLPGVARKTANIVLSSAFKKAEGIAVDTHVKRLSERLGLSTNTDPVKIERDLMDIVSKNDWLDFNYLMVDHGRKICIARKPLCPHCILNHLCPSAKKFYPINQVA